MLRAVSFGSANALGKFLHTHLQGVARQRQLDMQVKSYLPLLGLYILPESPKARLMWKFTFILYQEAGEEAPKKENAASLLGL